MPFALPVLMLVGAIAADSPMGEAPDAQTAALSLWSAAYRACYAPAHLSLRVDPSWTVHCIEEKLQDARTRTPAEWQGALQGLIQETSRLVSVLNAAPEENARAAERSGDRTIRHTGRTTAEATRGVRAADEPTRQPAAHPNRN